MKLLLLFVFVAVTSCLANSPLRFDGFQVYRVTPETAQQLEALKQLEENPQGFNFWSDVTGVGKHVDIMVPPHLQYNFQDLIELQKLDAKLWIENVQTLIDNEKGQSPKKAQTFNWEDYKTLEEIYEWFDLLIEQYPGVVTSVVGGHSYEGREIRGVKVSFGSGKKAVFLEGGIHAREWIAPATVTYILNELLTSRNASVRAIAESRDWHIFPSTNPDGYVYTRTNRMWRKTRQPYTTCVGADPNRNWDYHWMEGGASSNECSDTFAGSSAFSEIETKSLSEYISGIAKSVDIYLAFHSYSQLILIPFGHAGHEKPENNDELHRIAEKAVDSLAVRYGTQYEFGNIPEAIYVASGGSMDWVLGVHRHMKTVYTFELRDTGRHGFILPPEQIIPTGEETLDALVTIIQETGA